MRKPKVFLPLGWSNAWSNAADQTRTAAGTRRRVVPGRTSACTAFADVVITLAEQAPPPRPEARQPGTLHRSHAPQRRPHATPRDRMHHRRDNVYQRRDRVQQRKGDPHHADDRAAPPEATTCNAAKVTCITAEASRNAARTSHNTSPVNAGGDARPLPRSTTLQQRANRRPRRA